MGARESPWCVGSQWDEPSFESRGLIIVDSEWNAVQERSGRKFTWDACGNAPVRCDSVFHSPSGFLGAETAVGQHVWLLPPVADIASHLQHYRNLKAKSPHTTSACIMLPRWHGQKWHRWLKGMRLVAQFSRGDAVFKSPHGAGLCTSKVGLGRVV